MWDISQEKCTDWPWKIPTQREEESILSAAAPTGHVKGALLASWFPSMCATTERIEGTAALLTTQKQPSKCAHISIHKALGL